jgi:hypothetical protein
VHVTQQHRSADMPHTSREAKEKGPCIFFASRLVWGMSALRCCCVTCTGGLSFSAGWCWRRGGGTSWRVRTRPCPAWRGLHGTLTLPSCAVTPPALCVLTAGRTGCWLLWRPLVRCPAVGWGRLTYMPCASTRAWCGSGWTRASTLCWVRCRPSARARLRPQRWQWPRTFIGCV